MSISWHLAVFFGSLALTIISSLVLGNDLDRIGRRLHLSEGLIGLLSALGADTPEISSAFAALLAGSHDIGVGVVLGSNIFNLAGLLGLSALVAGSVRIGWHGLVLDGTVAMLVTLAAVGLVMGVIPPVLAVVLLCAVLLPYLAVLAMRPTQVQRLRLPASVHRFLDRAVVNLQQDAQKEHTQPQASWTEFLSVVPALASIVLGSFGMVYSARALGRTWQLSDVIIGTLVLAGLTSLPNVVTAVRLALHGRGAAVVSEALNSNTLNVLAGLCLPALFFPEVSRPTAGAVVTAWWLLVMTALALGAAYVRGGFRWRGGLALIFMYAAFAALVSWRKF